MNMRDLQVEKAVGRRGTGAPSEDPGFRGLLAEVENDGYRRLGWIALVMTGIMAALTLTPFVLPPEVERFLAVEWNSRLVLAGLSAAVALLCRWRGLPAGSFLFLALGYEVAVGAVMGSELLDWPGRINDGLYEGIPRAAVWIIFFANVVPLRPREHLAGALLTGAAYLLWFAVALEDAAPGPEPATTRTLLWQISISMAVATFLAWASARRVYGLTRALSRARRVGAYQLDRMLGTGGMGEVWSARHRMLARPAAIKLIRSDRVSDASSSDAGHYLERFQREVRATASLRSPHTIEVYDYGITSDRAFYYVMELLDGADLEEWVKRHGPMSPGRAIHLLRQVCHSLGEAHDAGLIHRDIKPANIFLCRYGRDVDHVKVLDFGLVKEVGATRDTNLTQMGTFAGTPAFAAPEAAAGKVDELGPAADVYSVGCLGYWLLTGSTVFRASNAMEMLAAHLRDDPQPPSARSSSFVPPELDHLVLACLEKDPDARIRSVDELDARLADLESAHPWAQEEARAWWVLHHSGGETS